MNTSNVDYIMIDYENKYDSNLESSPNTTNTTTPPVNSRSLSSNTSTFIVKGRKNALREAYNRSLSVKHSFYCVTGDELVKSYKPFVPLLQAQIDQLGGSSLIITNIEKDTIFLVRFFLELGVQIRHLKNLPPMNFAIGKEFQLHAAAPSLDEQYTDQIKGKRGEITTTLPDGYMLKSLLTSDEPTYVNRFSAIFEELWRNGIDAVDRIRDIEEGVDLADIKIIQNPKEGLS